MYKLKKFRDLEKRVKIEHYVAYGLELVMVLVSLGLLIYYLSIGDPLGRVLPTIGSIFVFVVPFIAEPLLKKRFSLAAHIAYIIIMTFNVFVGCALNYNGAPGPFDEISHFLFGYISSLIFFYFLVGWKDYDRQKTGFLTMTLFFFSMAIAPLWELFELLADGLLGTSAIGGVTEAAVEAGIAAGLSGPALNFYAIAHSTMLWDSITDMALHLGGSLIFTIEFLVYRHIKTPIFLERVRRDYLRNREDNYTFVGDDTDVKIANDIAHEITTEDNTESNTINN